LKPIGITYADGLPAYDNSGPEDRGARSGPQQATLMRFQMKRFGKVGLTALAIVSAVSAASYATAQMTSGKHDSRGMPHDMTIVDQASRSRQPTLPGQDAFGAIQEIVAILDADPNTDWSKVNIAALREHLIDMNEVTLHASAAETKLPNGVAIIVTGEGRTLVAIKRMVTGQGRQLQGMNGWSATTEELPNGVRLIVSTPDPHQVVKLQALGFMGLMAQGNHHQPHHLMMAKGEMIE
jgi:hypothetical protein